MQKAAIISGFFIGIFLKKDRFFQVNSVKNK